MIAGIGIDMCEKDRFINKLGDSQFLGKIFHPKELQYLEELEGKQERQSTYLAGRWAAKESFMKALGLGVFQLPLCQLCATRGSVCGVPYWIVEADVQTLLDKRQIGKSFLSISYEANLAVAMTVLELVENLST